MPPRDEDSFLSKLFCSPPPLVANGGPQGGDCAMPPSKRQKIDAVEGKVLALLEKRSYAAIAEEAKITQLAAKLEEITKDVLANKFACNVGDDDSYFTDAMIKFGMDALPASKLFVYLKRLAAANETPVDAPAGPVML
jgi:hypothetical protein